MATPKFRVGDRVEYRDENEVVKEGTVTEVHTNGGSVKYRIAIPNSDPVSIKTISEDKIDRVLNR